METATHGFASAHAYGADWETLTMRCLDGLGVLPEGANLGFVYVTDIMDDDCTQVVDRLRQATGISDWVGTIGFGVCASGHEFFDMPAMAVMVASIPADGFRLVTGLSKPGQALAEDVQEWVAKRRPGLGVVHGDPRNAYLPGILDSLTDDTDAFLVGGMTASRGKFHQIAGHATQGGLSGALFAEDVKAVTGLTQGCSPIGKSHDITASNGNVITELDGRPALDVFKEDIGEILARDLNRVGGYIHAALPIAGTDTGDYLVRNIIGIDPTENWIAIGERMNQGDKVMFVRRDVESARKDLGRMLDDVAKRANGTPKAALYYSCVARGANLFGQESEELKTIRDKLGDIPLVGFFANGEISNNRLYAYTGVLTLLL